MNKLLLPPSFVFCFVQIFLLTKKPLYPHTNITTVEKKFNAFYFQVIWIRLLSSYTLSNGYQPSWSLRKYLHSKNFLNLTFDSFESNCLKSQILLTKISPFVSIFLHSHLFCFPNVVLRIPKKNRNNFSKKNFCRNQLPDSSIGLSPLY